jgi:transposase
VLAIVRDDAVCRRLMTAPGVGPLVAVTFKSAVDDPSRNTKSKAVGALFRLTPPHVMRVDGTTYRSTEAEAIAVPA